MFSATVYDTTLDWLAVFDSTALPSVPLLPFRLASSPEYRPCGRSLRTRQPVERLYAIHVLAAGKTVRRLIPDRQEFRIHLPVMQCDYHHNLGIACLRATVFHLFAPVAPITR